MSRPSDPQQRPNKAAGGSVVFLGAFNPTIFQPAWFARHGLIPEDEDSIEMEAVTQHITSWAQSWLKVIVQPEKCELHASDEVASFRALEDLAQGVFTLLPHVPVTALGINRFVHFQVESEDAWNKLGFNLFTREPWEGVLDDPRMRTVQVESYRGEDRDGVITVTVQPSTQFKTAVYVTTNDHYVIDKDAVDAEAALARLNKVFDASMERSEKLIERVREIE